MEGNFPSETATLKCRFCRKQLLRKNYKSHIKDVHPGENFDDLKPCGQSTISDMFNRQIRDKVGNAGGNDNKEAKQGENEDAEEVCEVRLENTSIEDLDTNIVDENEKAGSAVFDSVTVLNDGLETSEGVLERDKKKRNASGDSGFGGDDGNSVAKKVKVDDAEEVTNKRFRCKIGQDLGHIGRQQARNAQPRF